MLSTLGKIFSRQHIEIFFLIFPRRQDLTFHADCLQWRHFAWNVKSCFPEKNKKNVNNLWSAELAQRVVQIKIYQCQEIVNLSLHCHCNKVKYTGNIDNFLGWKIFTSIVKFWNWNWSRDYSFCNIVTRKKKANTNTCVPDCIAVQEEWIHLGNVLPFCIRETTSVTSCIKILLKRVYFKSKEFAPRGSKFFPFTVDPCLKGMKNNFNRIVSLGSVTVFF